MRKEVALLLALALSGVALATYQTILYFQSVVSCTSHCDLIIKSSYATLFNIPVAVIGLAGFIAIAGLAAASICTKKNFAKAIFALSTAGIIFVAYLVYVEAAKLNAFCSLCTASHAIGAAIWSLALLALIKKKPVAH